MPDPKDRPPAGAGGKTEYTPKPPSGPPAGEEEDFGFAHDQAPPVMGDSPPQVEPDETIPGGRYIVGGKAAGDKHYGGKVVDAEGKTLGEYADHEINTGMPKKK